MFSEAWLVGFQLDIVVFINKLVVASAMPTMHRKS